MIVHYTIIFINKQQQCIMIYVYNMSKSKEQLLLKFLIEIKIKISQISLKTREKMQTYKVHYSFLVVFQFNTTVNTEHPIVTFCSIKYELDVIFQSKSYCKKLLEHTFTLPCTKLTEKLINILVNSELKILCNHYVVYFN